MSALWPAIYLNVFRPDLGNLNSHRLHSTSVPCRKLWIRKLTSFRESPTLPTGSLATKFKTKKMNKSTVIISLVAVMLAFLSDLCKSDQPPYQVSLYIRLHPKGRPIHLCNGAIIQNRLVLTSASCVHYQFLSNSPVMAIYPSMISVYAGSANAFSDALIFKVSSIDVRQGFNATTMENDLAILRLSASLPLGLRDDMKWIILDDDEYNQDQCLANFYIRNSMDDMPDYIQSEELQIFNSAECTKLSKYPNTRQDDICSDYVLPLGYNCNAVESFPSFNGDRGTGLVCNNRLVALLSTILPLQINNQSDCSEKAVKAFYTNLGPHLDWIYAIIQYEEYLDVMQEDYKAASPYQGETGAFSFMQRSPSDATSGVVESNSTTASTLDPVDDTTTGVSATTPRMDFLHSNSGHKSMITRSFLYGMWILNVIKHL